MILSNFTFKKPTSYFQVGKYVEGVAFSLGRVYSALSFIWNNHLILFCVADLQIC